MKDIPDLVLNPTPNEGMLPTLISHVLGAGNRYSFHLYHNKIYTGSMAWHSYGYWRVSCDVLQVDDMYILARLAQAHIRKYDPEGYRESGMPDDTDLVVLDQEWWDLNRERTLGKLKSKE